MARKKWGRSAWENACSLVESVDELPCVKTQGMWTAEKLYFLCSYLVQVLEGLHGHPAFSDGIVFIDCFAGSGVCLVKDRNDRVHRYPGSTVIAASLRLHGKSLSKIIAIEQDESHLAALKVRVARCGFPGETIWFHANFNEYADRVAAAIPKKSLNVAFLDPYALDCHYSAIAQLAYEKPLDLIVLFSDRIDLQRNVEQYANKAESKLDDFLGRQSGWRERYAGLPDQSGTKLRDMFAEIYLEQLAKLGYQHSDTWTLTGPMGPMFKLLFVSKHALGLKYCQIAKGDQLDGSSSLFT